MVDAGEFLLGMIIIIGWVVAMVIAGLFLYWIGRILIILPDRIDRITKAFEKIANK